MPIRKGLQIVGYMDTEKPQSARRGKRKMDHGYEIGKGTAIRGWKKKKGRTQASESYQTGDQVI